MKLLKQLAILTMICLVGGYIFIQSGIFNVAATVKDGPLITWLLHTIMEKSVERRAQDIEVPNIDNNEMILAGMSDYVEMCAQCHGEPDEPSSILRQGLNPAPPDLEHLTEAGTAAEMFWVINNGIRMTGMPAFGNTHQAEEIWPVVSFLQSASDITPSEYKRMKNEAESYGHHKSASHMNENSNHKHNHEETNVVHNGHDADTASTITSDSQISDVPPSHKKEERHVHQHGDEHTSH